MKRSIVWLIIALTSLLLCFGPSAAADKYPTKTLNWYTCAGAGGMTDTSVRLLAPKMEEFLGQQVFVENKPGAGGYTAIKFMLNGRPDGYTFLAMTTSNATSSVMYKMPVGLRTSWPFVMSISVMRDAHSRSSQKPGSTVTFA